MKSIKIALCAVALMNAGTASAQVGSYLPANPNYIHIRDYNSGVCSRYLFAGVQFETGHSETDPLHRIAEQALKFTRSGKLSVLESGHKEIYAFNVADFEGLMHYVRSVQSGNELYIDLIWLDEADQHAQVDVQMRALRTNKIGDFIEINGDKCGGPKRPLPKATPEGW